MLILQSFCIKKKKKTSIVLKAQNNILRKLPFRPPLMLLDPPKIIKYPQFWTRDSLVSRIRNWELRTSENNKRRWQNQLLQKTKISYPMWQNSQFHILDDKIVCLCPDVRDKADLLFFNIILYSRWWNLFHSFSTIWMPY
jgi:hypothetical protein